MERERFNVFLHYTHTHASMIDRKKEKGLMCSYSTHIHASMVDRKREKGLMCFYITHTHASMIERERKVSSRLKSRNSTDPRKIFITV